MVRSRWLIIFLTTAIAVTGVAAVSLLTTPLYQASTRLFVSTPASASATEIYQGNLFSQQRVLSYTKLLTGETLAQRTIDKLRLDTSAAELRKRVTASAPQDTVLIDVSVLDPSPTQARNIADALSDEFVVMVSELETPTDGDRPDARVVVEQRASIPQNPIFPKTTRNLTLGLVVGMLFGIGLAVLRQLLDNTVKDKQTLEQITGVGVAANVPLDKTRKKDPTIYFNTDQSAIAESFRELRTNLQFLEVDDPPRLLVITSSLPAEGKTSTAINIALALAEAEHNVVLVDGDLRCPKLDTHLDVVGSVGLSTVLSGRVSLSDVLQKTRFPGLTVLTSGAIPPNPSELLGSLATKKVLSEMRADFDYVIVDSSPLLPVTDGAILAAAADGVLLLARFGKTKRDQLTQSVENLKNVEARIVGSILTMVPTRGNTSYSYGYYGNADTSPANSSRHRERQSRRRNI